MTAPSVYSRAYNFRNYQTANPTEPLPGVQVDIELNNLKSVTDSLGDCINDVRRADGSLQNAVVTADSLDESALALIGAGNWTPRGIWATATAYIIGDVVRHTVSTVTTTYVCAIVHTSGTFSTDYTAAKWVDLTAARAAGLISYDPTVSGLVATDVKAALDEIDAKVDANTTAGELRAYAGLTAPSGWLLCYGQAVSRTTYATLLAAVTVTLTGTHTSGAPQVTGLSSTTDLVAGMPISGTKIPSSTTILTVDSSTQITLSQNASSSGSAAVVIAPWGVGDGSTTFNIPDLRGRTLVGRDDMGTVAASRVTSGTSGISATRVGATGGLQTLMAHTHTVDTKGTGTAGTTAAVMKANAVADGTITSSSTGTGSSHGNMQPSGVVNWLIKT